MHRPDAGQQKAGTAEANRGKGRQSKRQESQRQWGPVQKGFDLLLRVRWGASRGF